jgi:dihydropteroate synthase
MKMNIKVTLKIARDINKSLKCYSPLLVGMKRKKIVNIVITIDPPVQKEIFKASALLISV